MTQPPVPPQQPPVPPRPAATQPLPPAPTSAPPQGPPAGYYPPQPPGGYAPMPPPPGSLHKTGKGKTIGIIVAGVVGIGVLGGLGAVIFGGGDDDKDDVTTSEANGNGSGILDPEPVGTATPTADPTAAPTEASPTPEPTEEPTTPPVDGTTATIGSGVQVFVPSGWEIAGQGSDDIGLNDGNGSWAYALTGVGDPSVEASAVLSANLDSMLPPDNYSQLKTSDVRPLEAFGSLVSIAVMDYEALWVDSQATIPLHGQVYVAVRQDGVALLISVEHTPPGDFEAVIDTWAPVVDNSFNLLGGS